MAKLLNVGLTARVDAGKTTLTEQLLLTSGAIRQAGRVDDGTHYTDRLPLDRTRARRIQGVI